MTPDHELSAWQSEWRATTAPPPPDARRLHDTLRARVDRHSRRQRLLFAGDVLVTVLIGGGSILWTMGRPTMEMVQLTGAIWGFIVAAWIFTVTNRRGTWTPSDQSTDAFLTLSIRRGRRRLTSVSFVALFGLVEVLFCLIWAFRHHQARDPLWSLADFIVSTAFIITIVISLAGLAGLGLYRARAQDDLDSLLRLRQQMSYEGLVVEDGEREAADDHRWDVSSRSVWDNRGLLRKKARPATRHLG